MPVSAKVVFWYKTLIKTSPHLLVPADKTSNFYKMDSNTYNSLLQKNIAKTYKKVQPNTIDSIELDA